MPELDTADSGTGIDMESAVDRLGSELFPETDAPDTPEMGEDVETPSPELKTPTDNKEPLHATETPQEQPISTSAPKSWPKEMHDHWSKTPPEVQKYWETREKQMLDGLDEYKGAAQFGKSLHDVITPFRHILQAQGLDAPRAISTLLQAQQRLTTGTAEQRRMAYEELGRNLGLTAQTPSEQGATPPIDPRIQTLEQRLEQVQSTLTAQQQVAMEAAKTKASAEVEAFASDASHPFFDECADDIIRFITQGASLQEAYEKAVWANPVTREKQVQTRLQTEADKARERARLDALPKKKAAGVNVRSRETQRTPTEPLGSMEETMRDTLKQIRTR